VLSRLDGPTLLQLLRTRAMTPEQAGAVLAALSISFHKTPPPLDVISLRDLIHALLQSPGNLLPKHLATGVLALFESLSGRARRSWNALVMSTNEPRYC